MCCWHRANDAANASDLFCAHVNVTAPCALENMQVTSIHTCILLGGNCLSQRRVQKDSYKSTVYAERLRFSASGTQDQRSEVQCSTPVHGHFTPSIRLNFHYGANSTSQSRRGAEPDVHRCLFGRPPRKHAHGNGSHWRLGIPRFVVL